MVGTHVLDAVEDYRQEEDVLGHFLAERTVKDGETKTDRRDLCEAYKRWAEIEGDRFPVTATKLAIKLKERGIKDGGKSGDRRFWLGIALADVPLEDLDQL